MVVSTALQAVVVAFAARIGCEDTPSSADWTALGFDPDPLARQQTGTSEVVLARWLTVGVMNGQAIAVFNVHRVPVATLVAIFGALFVAGKPTAAQFTAACNALPATPPAGWTSPWPPGSWCRGFCRYADKFKMEGILS